MRLGFQASALPPELRNHTCGALPLSYPPLSGRGGIRTHISPLVGMVGFEPTTLLYPKQAGYQAAPHPVNWLVVLIVGTTSKALSGR